MPPHHTVSLDVAGLRADAGTLDALARFALDLRRCGYDLRLRHPSQELLGLIELAGLAETLRLEDVTPGLTEPRC